MANNAQMAARIAELEAKLADAESKAKSGRVVSVKAKDTGTVCVYGLRARFPASYYPAEWDVIFAHKDAILKACTPEQRKLAEDNRAKKS
jgi:hypothetical protein